MLHPPLTVSLTNETECFNGINGVIHAEVDGGSGVYQYNWSNGNNGTELINLTAGNYSLSVDDGAGCTMVQSISIGPDLECGCEEDLNYDGIVDVNDLLVFINQFGCVNNCTSDFDDDGVVGTTDLILMLGAFNTSCTD